jgi:hypothetical protein
VHFIATPLLVEKIKLLNRLEDCVLANIANVLALAIFLILLLW